jgi:hypothetical protein
MAGNEHYDDTISAWLTEGAPGPLPERVLGSTFERTRRTRQEARWATRLRWPRMAGLVPALGAAGALVVVGVLVVGAAGLLGPAAAPSPTPRPSGVQAGPGEVGNLLHAFLDARIAGTGAHQYLSSSSSTVPLMYATSTGQPYDRGDFEQVDGVTWPYGLTAYRLRLGAGATVVEQLVFVALGSPELSVDYEASGFATHLTPTTENGRPVPVTLRAFGGAVTLDIADPWICAGRCDGTANRLLPDDPALAPTTDGGERNDWDPLYVIDEPLVWPGPDCHGQAPDNVSAQVLADLLTANPGLRSTSPVAARVGGAPALIVDVKPLPGTLICRPATEQYPDDTWLLRPLEADQPGTNVTVTDGILTEPASGEWLRIYLIDAPTGSPLNVVAVVIAAPESRFDRVVVAAQPVLDSLRFGTQ